MYNYTHNQHFKFGYDGEWFNSRRDQDSQWQVEYGQCERVAGSFRDEVLHVARLVEDQSKSLGLPIDIMYSGGTESEMMLRSFTEQGINVRVNILRFKDKRNYHDIKSAEKFCSNHGITPYYHDLDILKFWEGLAYEYAERTRCTSPQLLSTMWLMDQLDGLPCLGSGECYISYGDMEKYQYLDKKALAILENPITDYPKRPWYMHERERIAAWYRHAMIQDRPAVPGYFQYTPEVMLSFLLDSTTRELANCEHWGKLSNASTKKTVYEKYFPNLIQRTKTTGFEQVMGHDHVIRKELDRLWGNYNAEVVNEYNQLVEHLKGYKYEQ